MGDKVVRFPGAARVSSVGRLLIPSRLKDARKAARLTQGELGEKIGVTRQAVSAYERGDKVPEPMVFQRIVEALKQPTTFFTGDGPSVFGQFSTRFFRKVGPDTVRRNEACDVLGQWFVQTAFYLNEFVSFPDVVLPEAEPDQPDGTYSIDAIDEVAINLRRQWGLGAGPISNVLALVESKGIIVCKYEMTDENVEAFSFWNGNRAFIFMASEKTAGVRLRYDLAHELGHLILHRWVEQSEISDPTRLKVIENEANRFAGAFLLPKTSFPNEVYTLKLDAFIPLKERWKVSIQSMIYRCKDLEIIDSDQFMNLYKQISFRKWRKSEPLDDPGRIQIEQPKMLRRAMEMVVNNRKNCDEIINDLRFSGCWIEIFCNLPPGSFAAAQDAEPDPPLNLR